MKVVWKYPLDTGRTANVIEMPYGAELIHVGLDPGGQPCVWATVDPHATDTERRRLDVLGTGEAAVRPGTPHVGSFLQSPSYMIHVFDGGTV